MQDLSSIIPDTALVHKKFFNCHNLRKKSDLNRKSELIINIK